MSEDLAVSNIADKNQFSLMKETWVALWLFESLLYQMIMKGFVPG